MPRLIPRTEQLATKIVEGLSELNLYRLCQKKGYPSRWTVLRWMDDDPEFATRCARAEKMRGQVWSSKVEVTADKCTEENAHASKVQISAYQWLASKEDAKYGDRVALAGDADAPLRFTLERIGKE